MNIYNKMRHFTKLPSLTRKQVKSIKPNQVHEILGRKMLVDGYDLVFDPIKSKGFNLHDSRTGENYLDAFGFFWK